MVLETVTDCSCIASRSADCVLGVARLISSARRMWAKIGPFWKSKYFEPASSSTIMLVPMMSAGIRSGVNWMRENVASMHSASVRTSIVLPRPGTPSRSACPPARSVVMTPSTISSWPTIILAISVRRRVTSVKKRSASLTTLGDALPVSVLASAVISSPLSGPAAPHGSSADSGLMFWK